MDTLKPEGQDFKRKYPEVFKEGLGLMKGVKGVINIHKDAVPKFCKARTVPYAMRERVEAELERLEAEGIIEAVRYSDWATPIVPILKKDGSIRICGDYKITVNRVAKIDSYPIPKIEDLYTNLVGGKMFSTLDLSNAYLQMPLEEESKNLTTINTSRGLFKYNRLCFGIAAAPAIFQRVMDSLLQGLNMVCGYLDDILITGKDKEEHDKNVNMVLKRLDMAGIRVRSEKCTFGRNQVEYLGYIISAEGLHPVQKKVKAIIDAPSPENSTQLRAFLGMINYYGKFLNNLSNLFGPLHELLKKGKSWKWSKECEKSFKQAKMMLTSSKVLVHFDSKRNTRLTCDASQYGIGAVLSQEMDNGEERPVAFASRSLGQAEKNYSQIEKEALGVVFGVKKFHKYLFGRKFTIANDHKPLLTLLNEAKSVPAMVSGRIQRWALLLSAYEYVFEYKPGSKIANADAMSRLPLKTKERKVPIPEEMVFNINKLDEVIERKDLQKATNEDRTLTVIRRHIQEGWPEDKMEEVWKPYYRKKLELLNYNELVWWGSRIIVPYKLQKAILETLHEGHPGIVRMKSLARSYVWWPSLDLDIESMVKECGGFQQVLNKPDQIMYSPWMEPSGPWQRIHIDYAGPYLGEMFLVVVDAYSRWLEVKVMKGTTSGKTIEELRSIFATHGFPQVIVSDNAPNFASEEFKVFLKQNGIKHIFTPPYHPNSNGLAERAVQTFKKALVSSGNEESLKTRLSKFLLRYRITPHSVTNISPAERLMKRKLRTRLDAMFPVENKVIAAGRDREKIRNELLFSPGDTVSAVDFRPGHTWIEGRIEERKNNLVWILLKDGRRIRRHLDHVRTRRSCNEDKEAVPELMDTLPREIPEDSSIDANEEIRESPTITSSNDTPVEISESDGPLQNGVEMTQEGVPVRKSGRTIRIPNRYQH